RYAEYMLEGAELVVVAYGTAGRIVQTAVKQAREEGIPAGLFRPISMFPFPYARLKELAATAKRILVVELSGGQMIEDVRLATCDQLPVSFYGRMGGVVPVPDDVLDEIRKLVQ
ncbi:MAG: transketolase C-terminal domain-containing protein, partial [Anaerolineae bacterium]